MVKQSNQITEKVSTNKRPVAFFILGDLTGKMPLSQPCPEQPVLSKVERSQMEIA
jgi:hypothetical protein